MTTISVTSGITSTVSTDIPGGTSYVVETSGTLTVSSGGTVSGLIAISSGGRVNVEFSGSTLDVIDAGLLYLNGGTASGTTISSGGELYSDEGVEFGTIVQGGSETTILASATSTTVGSGGLTVTSKTTIASGYGHQCDPVTFVDAPTGLVYNHATDTLYVASTVDNAIFAVSNASTRTSDAGTGQAIYRDQTHLHGALGLAAAPDGNLLVSNNDAINPDPNQPSEIVEFTLSGRFVKELSMDPNQGGSFGLSVQTTGLTSYFAAVDDNQNDLNIWTLPTN